jgi:glutamate synthase domain-containing protein 3
MRAFFMKSTITIDAAKKTTTEFNLELKAAAEKGADIRVLHPQGRHNLGVCILKPCRITFEGSVGYYCASMLKGPNVLVKGNAGWGFGEHLMAGSVRITGDASLAAAASIKGGEVIVEGNAGARAGISLKGGLVVIGGNAGFMTGFIAQLGRIIICGDADNAVGDSMYESLIYVGGKIASVGTDSKVVDMSQEETTWLGETLERLKIKSRNGKSWKKVESMKTLYQFDKLKLKDRHVI